MRYVMALVAAVCFVTAGAGLRADEPRAGQVISLEVLVADVGAAALGEGDVTAAKILALAAEGKLDAATRVQLSVLENTPGIANFSEVTPVAVGQQEMAGILGGRRGGGAYSNQNHGTTVQTTGRVEQDGTIVLELQAERSRLIANRPAGEEGAAASVAPTKTAQIRVNTTTRLASGKPTIVGSQSAGVGRDAMHTYVVLTASVPEGAKAAGAAPVPVLITKVVALSHARAADLARILQSIFEGQRITIVADERSNALVIHGAETSLETAIALISRLDES